MENRAGPGEARRLAARSRGGEPPARHPAGSGSGPPGGRLSPGRADTEACPTRLPRSGPGPSDDSLSLRQFLVRTGAGSRRSLLGAAQAGRLRLNGQPTADLDTRVRPGVDRVEMDGRRLFVEGTLVYLAVNKPPGYLSTCRDERGRRTVLALVPPALQRFRLFPVGRLDAASRGLLLLTNDGGLAYRLTHPRFGVEKEYEATLLRALESAAVQKLREGVLLADGPTLPAQVHQAAASTAGVRYRMILREGRNQEVRRMVAAVGGQLRDLVRTRIGSLRLGRLRAGQARLLRPEEIRALQAPSAGGGRVIRGSLGSL